MLLIGFALVISVVNVCMRKRRAYHLNLAQALLNQKTCSQAVTNERNHRHYIDKEAGRGV